MTKRYLSEGEEALLEKFAWPYDPAQVAQQTTNPRLKAHLRRGQWMADQLPHLAQMGRDAWSGAKSLGNAALAPASSVGPSALRGLGNIGSHLKQNPHLLGRGLAVAAVAPILMNAFESSDQKYEDSLMSAYQNPDRTVTASLEEFLEKKAASYGQLAGQPGYSQPSHYGVEEALRNLTDGVRRGGATSAGTPGGSSPTMMGSIGAGIRDSFTSGIGSGVGKGLVDTIFGLLGGIVNAGKDVLITEPKRKAILETVMRQDQVIADAISHHPDGEHLVMEAYGTMVRVAPTLSMDINAVRSFLREAVIGGAGVNYATIKNLADTEKALAEARRARGG